MPRGASGGSRSTIRRTPRFPLQPTSCGAAASSRPARVFRKPRTSAALAVVAASTDRGRSRMCSRVANRAPCREGREPNPRRGCCGQLLARGGEDQVNEPIPAARLLARGGLPALAPAGIRAFECRRCIYPRVAGRLLNPVLIAALRRAWLSLPVRAPVPELDTATSPDGPRLIASSVHEHLAVVVPVSSGRLRIPASGGRSGHRMLEKTRPTSRWASFVLAGGLGFEPRLTESESAVLPLDDPPKTWRDLGPGTGPSSDN